VPEVFVKYAIAVITGNESIATTQLASWQRLFALSSLLLSFFWNHAQNIVKRVSDLLKILKILIKSSSQRAAFFSEKRISKAQHWDPLGISATSIQAQSCTFRSD
jgi:hypothetical protein